MVCPGAAPVRPRCGTGVDRIPGPVVAQRTFTLGQGWYWWSFGVHQVFSGLSAVCITADDSFGVPCLHFGT